MWLLGCSPSPPETAPATDTPPVVLSAGVQDAARQRGRAIAAEAFALLSANLQSAIQAGGVSNALPFCSLAASPLTASLAEKHGVTLRRITHKPRNPQARADAAGLAILKSFETALAHGATNPPPSPVVTNLDGYAVTFFAPIVLNNELCLKCHGDPGQDIAPADLEVIRSLYRQDEATGFRLGQLRGAWRIDFNPATFSEKLDTP